MKFTDSQHPQMSPESFGDEEHMMQESEPFASLWYDLQHQDNHVLPTAATATAAVSVERGGLTQEHLLPISSRKWKVVLSWVAFHPDELCILVDREGQTALHHVCLFRAPAVVVEAMLYACPELTSMANDEGELPLHWAVRLALPLEIISLLLAAHPQSGFAQDKLGQTPMLLLWDRHEDTLVQVCRSYGRDNMMSLGAWKRIMLLVKAYCNILSINFRPLHALVECPCPPSFFQFAVQVCKDDLNIPDDSGHLPLAIASGKDDTKLPILLQAYPDAARVVDSMGRLPLHIAIASGKSWESGIEILLNYEPRALTTRDRASKLYPFQMAAVTSREGSDCTNSPDSTCDLDTIFQLILADPECVRPFP